MNVTLRQLRAFVAVARTGSFTLAAESLFITQSALSGLIKELEQALGLRLFDRSTRRLQLSDAGSDLVTHIEKILLDLDGVIDEVGKLKALHRGLVRVAVPQLMACTLMPGLMASFRNDHPQVQLRLVDSLVEQVINRVFTGEVDFGLGPERAPNSDIEATQLFELPFMAALPRTHRLACQRELRWADLAGDPLITLQGQFTERLATDLGAARRNVTLEPANEVAFMSTALSMVAAGLGLTICIPYAAEMVQQYGLVLRPVVDPVVLRGFYIFRRRGRTLSPAAQRFHDFICDELHQHRPFERALREAQAAGLEG